MKKKLIQRFFEEELQNCDTLSLIRLQRTLSLHLPLMVVFWDVVTIVPELATEAVTGPVRGVALAVENPESLGPNRIRSSGRIFF